MPFPRLHSISRKRAAVAIFLLAFSARVAYIFLTETYAGFRGSEMWSVAMSIHEGRGFENPYVDDGSPTAIVPPGYPLLLALIYRVFGPETAGPLVQQLLASAVTSTTFALLPLVSYSLLGSAAPGIVGGLMGALFPGFLWVETASATEKPYAALFCILLFWLFHKKWFVNEPSLLVALGTGLFAGVAFLFAPHLAPSFALLTLLFQKGRRYITRAVVMAAVILIVLTPWMARCREVFGEFVPMRSLYGLELQVSNNELAAASHHENLVNGSASRYHPTANLSQRARMLALGEPAYGRQMQSGAISWIKGNPLKFAELTMWRSIRFWIFGNRSYKVVFSALLVAAAWLGLFRLWGHGSAAPLLAVWLVFPAPYYPIQAAEYIYPIYWTLLLLAGVPLTGYRRSHPREPLPHRSG